MRMNVNIGTRGAKKGCTILRASLDPTPSGENTVSVKNERSVHQVMAARRRVEARRRIARAEEEAYLLKAMMERQAV
jgi:hypothetical protein